MTLFLKTLFQKCVKKWIHGFFEVYTEHLLNYLLLLDPTLLVAIIELPLLAKHQ